MTAKWILVDNTEFSPFDGSPEYLAICSNCGKVEERQTKFCPKCGAEMKGKVVAED